MSENLPPVMTLEALRSVPLFASLDDEATRELRDLLKVRDVLHNTPLFIAGDKGDAMFLIEKGRVRISVRDADGDEVVLTDLARGDFFGEMALIDGKSRSADATVIEDARLAVLSREDFLGFIKRNPEVALKMMSAITDRLRHTDQLLRHRVSRNVNEVQAEHMTVADRMADNIAEFGGSWTFIMSAIGIIILWMILNSLILSRGFDPAPYQGLNLLLGVIAGLQAPIIMMSQNRQGQKDRLRADLDYEVNLKNELALAEVLRRLDVLESERLPILFAEQNQLIASELRKREQNLKGI